MKYLPFFIMENSVETGDAFSMLQDFIFVHVFRVQELWSYLYKILYHSLYTYGCFNWKIYKTVYS